MKINYWKFFIAGPGSPPQNVQAKVDGPTVELTFEPPEIPNGIINSYQIFFTLNSSQPLAQWDSRNSKHENITILGLEPESKYSFRIRAIGLKGPGLLSPIFQLETGKSFIAPTVRIRQGPDAKVAPEETLDLVCEGTGDPKPSLIWLKNGAPVNEHEKPKIAEASTLKIVGVVESVLLVCEASNLAGKARAAIQVHVTGKKFFDKLEVEAQNSLKIWKNFANFFENKLKFFQFRPWKSTGKYQI